MLTSIDREGTGKGFDIDLLKKIRAEISIPLVAHGGFGNHIHISDAILQGGQWRSAFIINSLWGVI